MDYSVTFARHFARLLWLPLREPTNIEEQKAALRALVTVSTDGAVTLTLDGAELVAIDAPEELVPQPNLADAPIAWWDLRPSGDRRRALAAGAEAVKSIR